MSKEALEKSIEHWEKNLEKVKKYELFPLGADECSLCNLYVDASCIKCPIYLKTQEPYCKNTPFMDVDKTVEILEYLNEKYSLTNENFFYFWQRLREDVIKEIEFLKSLRNK